MTVKTTSEILFERFCAEAKIRYVPIPRDSEKRTPDYDLVFCATKIVVEVKEIERNEEEKESDRQLELRGYGNATGGVVGQRIRQKIDRSSKQIKARSQGVYPSLLVLYEQHRAGINIESYQVLVAMYGLETFILAVPKLGPPRVSGTKFGPRRKMTPNANTSISAIATLLKSHTGELRLKVFHNKFAEIPISPPMLAPYPIEQFRLGESEPDSFQHWEHMTHLS